MDRLLFSSVWMQHWKMLWPQSVVCCFLGEQWRYEDNLGWRTANDAQENIGILVPEDTWGLCYSCSCLLGTEFCSQCDFHSNQCFGVFCSVSWILCLFIFQLLYAPFWSWLLIFQPQELWLVLESFHFHYYLSRQLAYGAATKLLHPSVTGQPLDGAPTVVHVLHFGFQLKSLHRHMYALLLPASEDSFWLEL